MKYTVMYNDEHDRIRCEDFNATEERKIIPLARTIVNEARLQFKRAHPSVTVRKSWYNLLVVQEYGTGKIIYPEKQLTNG